MDGVTPARAMPSSRYGATDAGAAWNPTRARRWQRSSASMRWLTWLTVAVVAAVAIACSRATLEATMGDASLMFARAIGVRGDGDGWRGTRLLTTRELEALGASVRRDGRFAKELLARERRGEIRVMDPFEALEEARMSVSDETSALGGFFDFLSDWAKSLKKLTGKFWRRYVAKYVKHVASAANSAYENANLKNVITDVNEGLGDATNFVKKSATSAYYNYGVDAVRHFESVGDAMESAVNDVAELGEVVATQVSSGAIDAFECASGALDEMYDQTSGFVNDAVDVIEDQVEQMVDFVGDVIAMLELLFGGLECLASQDLLFDFARELHKMQSKDSVTSLVKNIREQTKDGGFNKYLEQMDDTLCHATWIKLFPNVNTVANAFKSFAIALRSACPAIGKAGNLPAFTFGVDVGVDVNSGLATKGLSTEVGVGLDLNGRQFCYAAGCVKSGGVALAFPGASAGASAVLTGYKDITMVPGRAEFLTLGFGINIPPPIKISFDVALTYVYADPSLANFAGVSISYEVGGASPDSPVTLEISQGFCQAICIEKHGGDCGSSEGALLGTHLHPTNSSWQPFALLGKPFPFFMEDSTAKCYLNRYADLFRRFGEDLDAAKNHFQEIGQHEGRIAHCSISDADLKCYLARYADLPWSQPNDGRTHFFKWGWKQGRTVKCAGDVDRYKYNFDDAEMMYDYDAVCYIDNYADVRKAFGFDLTKAKTHYLVRGIQEKRKAICTREPVIDDVDAMCFASNFWDVHRYYGQYPGRNAVPTDLPNIKTFMRATHKQEARKKLSKCERVTRADFKCYLERYPDVPRSNDDDFEAARRHWLQTGWKEGKNPRCASRPHFYRHAMEGKHWPYIRDDDAQCYLDRYPDIAKKYRHLHGQAKLNEAKKHYIVIGRRMRRDPTCAGPNEATKCYIARYSDVRREYSTHKSLEKAAHHMRSVGVDEERDTQCALTNDDLRCYVTRYPDLKEKFKDDLALAREHFFSEGYKTGLNPNCDAPKFFKTFTGQRVHADLSWTLNNERGFKQCQDDCLANPMCVGINYETGKCWIKGTATSKPLSYDVLVESRAQFYYRAVDGFSPSGTGDRTRGIIGSPTRNVNSLDACAKLCRDESECIGFSFHSRGLCQLKRWSGLSFEWSSNGWMFYRKLVVA